MTNKIKRKGLTILELLVVIAIIAILTVVVVPRFVGLIDRAEDSKEKAEINGVRKSAQMFYIDNGYYPTLQGNQPTFGDPKNIKFEELMDKRYLTNLPSFSYWYIDGEGLVYHVSEPINEIDPETGESLIGADGKIILNSKLEFKDKTTNIGVPYKQPVNKSKSKEVYPAIIMREPGDPEIPEQFKNSVTEFEGTIRHPEDTESIENDSTGGSGGEEDDEEDETTLVAVIGMTPEQDITTETVITWSYVDSTPADDIVNVEWEGKETTYTEPGRYTVRLRVQNSKGIWSDWVEKSFDVETADFDWKNTEGLEAVFDGNLNTYYRLYGEGEINIEWYGFLENRALPITLDISNPYATTGRVEIVFLDSSNHVLEHLEYTGSNEVKSTVRAVGRLGEKGTITLVVPVNAKRMRFITYDTHTEFMLYEIHNLADKELPNSVSNLVATPENLAINLTWNNPLDEDFSKVALYKDNVFMGYLTGNSYRDTAVFIDTTYTYDLYAIDTTGNRSYKSSVSAIPLTPDFFWIGDSELMFHGNGSTYYGVPRGGTSSVTWYGDLEGKTVDIKIYISASSSGTRGHIQILDAYGSILKDQTLTKYVKDETFRWVIPVGAKSILFSCTSGDNEVFRIHEITKIN